MGRFTGKYTNVKPNKNKNTMLHLKIRDWVSKQLNWANCLISSLGRFPSEFFNTFFKFYSHFSMIFRFFLGLSILKYWLKHKELNFADQKFEKFLLAPMVMIHLRRTWGWSLSAVNKRSKRNTSKYTENWILTKIFWYKLLKAS